jgi:hypothetical protein
MLGERVSRSREHSNMSAKSALQRAQLNDAAVILEHSNRGAEVDGPVRDEPNVDDAVESAENNRWFALNDNL